MPDNNVQRQGEDRRSIPQDSASLPVESTADRLARYRCYLMQLARMNMPLCYQTKQNPSDLVQQTLLRANNAMNQPEWTVENDLAWVRKIFANVLADEARRANRQKRMLSLEQSLEAALDESSCRLENFLAADQSTPCEHAIHREKALRIAEVMALLPDDQRTALELHHLTGLSLVETAEQMQRSHAAVAGLLRRGLQALRKSLADMDD